jgi:glucose-6-phosphate isomerase
MLDVSRVRFGRAFLARCEAPMERAFGAMEALEAGTPCAGPHPAVVGHYWLRAPGLSPTREVGVEIARAVDAVAEFAERVRRGRVSGDRPISRVVHIGVGGSSIGPQLMCDALAFDANRIHVRFLDNADPESVDRVLGPPGALRETLISVVSKSGVTPTTRYLTQAVAERYRAEGLEFAAHAVATTMPGSPLESEAREARWLATFPIWEWVGGRTSVTSAAGLLPAALKGADIGLFLAGAAAMDEATRSCAMDENPAALLALAWHWLGNGRGDRHMVLLPYCDRLALLTRHVQQLVMESLGKRADRAGRIVHQGLTVFGHKGVTDQHSYFQQLRHGRDDAFVTFVAVCRSATAHDVEIEPGITLDDYLYASLYATRAALWSAGRQSITIELDALTPWTLGALIALFERAVGLYAELIDVNAYDQPAIEKDIARGTLELQQELLAVLHPSRPRRAEELAAAVGRRSDSDLALRLLERLAETGDCVVSTDRGFHAGPRPYAGSVAPTGLRSATGQGTT